MIEKELASIAGVELFMSIDLHKFTTMQLKAIGDVLIIKNVQALELAVDILKRHSKKFCIVGKGANQVLSSQQDSLYLKLDFNFDRSYFEQIHETYDLPASINLASLTKHAVQFGLKGWEVFTGVPATLGGAIFMNAGTSLGEIGELVQDITILRYNGEIEIYQVNEKSFSYRKNHFLSPGDIIISARLKSYGTDDEIPETIKNYLKKRNKTQPMATRNCGCVFKNYSTDTRAGHMIDLLGLKGLTLNGLMVSHKHSNFIENYDGGSVESFNQLVNLINQQAMNNLGHEFELEVKIY